MKASPDTDDCDGIGSLCTARHALDVSALYCIALEEIRHEISEREVGCFELSLQLFCDLRSGCSVWVSDCDLGRYHCFRVIEHCSLFEYGSRDHEIDRELMILSDYLLGIAFPGRMTNPFIPLGDGREHTLKRKGWSSPQPSNKEVRSSPQPS